MKLRINGNSIRLRLTQGDVKRLVEDGAVNESIDFGSGKASFGYDLELSKDTVLICCVYENSRIRVLLPEKLALDWSASDDVSIGSDDESLFVLVEKDFMCPKPRLREDESDMFPNPEKENC